MVVTLGALVCGLCALAAAVAGAMTWVPRMAALKAFVACVLTCLLFTYLATGSRQRYHLSMKFIHKLLPSFAMFSLSGLIVYFRSGSAPLLVVALLLQVAGFFNLSRQSFRQRFANVCVLVIYIYSPILLMLYTLYQLVPVSGAYQIHVRIFTSLVFPEFDFGDYFPSCLIRAFNCCMGLFMAHGLNMQQLDAVYIIHLILQFLVSCAEMRLLVRLVNLNHSMSLGTHIHAWICFLDVTTYGWWSNAGMVFLRTFVCCYHNLEIYLVNLVFDLIVFYIGGDFSADALFHRRVIR